MVDQTVDTRHLMVNDNKDAPSTVQSVLEIGPGEWVRAPPEHARGADRALGTREERRALLSQRASQCSRQGARTKDRVQATASSAPKKERRSWRATANKPRSRGSDQPCQSEPPVSNNPWAFAIFDKICGRP